MAETKEKIEVKEYSNHCCCECCPCKKIFMHIVMLLLAFIAGIMVGNCRPCYYPNNTYYAMPSPKHLNKIKKHKLHRGMHQVEASPTSTSAATSTQSMQQAPSVDFYPDSQIGGFLIEVDQGY